MNAPEKVAFLPDIQSDVDGRGLSIDAVGIKDIRYPIKVRSGKRVLSTIAMFSMTVSLSAVRQGHAYVALYPVARSADGCS